MHAPPAAQRRARRSLSTRPPGVLLEATRLQPRGVDRRGADCATGLANDERPHPDPEDRVGRVGRVANDDMYDTAFCRERRRRQPEDTSPPARQPIALEDTVAKAGFRKFPFEIG